jgi:Transposase IS4
MAKRLRGEAVLDLLGLNNSSEQSSSDSEFVETEGESDDSDNDESGGSPGESSDDDEPEQGEQRAWTRMTAAQNNFNIFPFTVANPGFQLLGANIPVDELAFFQLFFTDNLFAEITAQTNEFAQRKLAYRPLQKYSIWRTWIDVSVPEMKAYVGVVLNMAMNDKPQIFDYFSKSFTKHMPFFCEVFTRTRFLQIHWMLHLSPVTVGRQTRASKVQNVSEYIQSKCQELFVPHRDIAIDESTIGFKGRVAFKMYNPLKPTKWGLRVFVLADSITGFISVFEPYFGKETTDSLVRPELPFATRIVVHLLDKLLSKSNGTGYHLFTDRYYTSPQLAHEALEMNIHTTGTVQKNRKNLPVELKKKQKMKLHEVIAYERDNELMALTWQDKRPVIMLSTYHDASVQPIKRRTRAGEETIQKPSVIVDYTAKMGAVDHADQMCGSYNFARKSFKWWRKMYFWLLEVAVTNSFVLFNLARDQRGEPPVSHLAYREKLVMLLVGNIRSESVKRGRPSTMDSAERLNGKPHFVGQLPAHGACKDCAVCSKRKEPGGRKKTVYFCKTCARHPGLHPVDCFERYHTLQNYHV